MDMKYWERFENSGKIEDYLSFVFEERQNRTQNAGWTLENSHAGTYIGDRNDTEADSGGRVRQAYRPFD